MQFWKVVGYKLRVFKLFLINCCFLCRNTLTVPSGLHTLSRRKKTGVRLNILLASKIGFIIVCNKVVPTALCREVHNWNSEDFFHQELPSTNF